MSENKDLDEIKQQLQVGIDGMDWDGEFDGSAYKKIIAAATRMALKIDELKDEIEYLKDQLEDKNEVIKDLKSELHDVHLELKEAWNDRL